MDESGHTEPAGAPLCKSTGRPDWLSRLPLANGSCLAGCSCAIVSSALAWLVRDLADPLLPPGFPFLTFFPAVILTAFLFGLRAGIVAAVLSGLLAWYFFIEPRGSLVLSFNAGVAMLFYTFVVGVDIALVHLMQAANHRLAEERERSLELVRHRELLFSELQHRVGNNLQMSASLLSLQKRKLVEPEARAAIDEAARRLGMIGRVQRQLYAPDGAQLDLATFLGTLARDVIESSGRDGIAVRVEAGQNLTLPPASAIPTALIVTESVSNALEHGLAGVNAGTIDMAVHLDGDRLLILVSDDGAGLSPQFAAQARENLGLRICSTLAQGLHGSYRLEQGAQGACARLELPYS